MSSNPSRHDRPISDELPPIVYKVAAGCVLAFVVLAWIFFSAWPHMGLVLAIVSVFFFMALAIPSALWLAARSQRDSGTTQPEAVSWRDWAAGEFAASQDHLKGANAAVEALLPIAATAVGMMAIGIAFYVVSAGAS
jgi:hypothetical protein